MSSLPESVPKGAKVFRISSSSSVTRNFASKAASLRKLSQISRRLRWLNSCLAIAGSPSTLPGLSLRCSGVRRTISSNCSQCVHFCYFRVRHVPIVRSIGVANQATSVAFTLVIGILATILPGLGVRPSIYHLVGICIPMSHKQPVCCVTAGLVTTGRKSPARNNAVIDRRDCSRRARPTMIDGGRKSANAARAPLSAGRIPSSCAGAGFATAPASRPNATRSLRCARARQR